MKKQLSKLVAALAIIAILFNLNTVAFAGVVSEPEPPINVDDGYPADMAFLSSEGALRAYAVEMGRGCRIGVGMNSTTESVSSWTGGWDRPMNSVDMFRFIDSLFNNLWIKTVNPSDWVWAYGTITSADGEDLLYGGGSTYPVIGKGGSVDLPTFKVRYELAPTICIPFEGVESAEMFVTDPVTGQTVNTVNLGASGGRFCFQTDMAGKGPLVIRTKNGATLIYDLANNGVRTVTEQIEFVGKVTSSIDHLIPIINPTQAYTHAERSWDGVGVNPTFEVIIDFPLKDSKLDLTVSSTEGARPIAFIVRAQGNPHWKMVMVEGGRLYMPGPLERAVYYAVPVWNPEEFRTHQPYTDGPVAVPAGKGEKG